MARRSLRITSWLLGLALIGSAFAEDDPSIRTINAGAIHGTRVDGVLRFMGIPYAAPPVKGLRWRPPQPPLAWRGVRDATHMGPHCPQNDSLGPFATPSNTEDCLYLNVFTPSADTSERLPVMLWFHGGSPYAGESDDYDGGRLAKEGRVVVVTINYRIGILGWFAHPTIDHEGHEFGNYGLLDQQFALEWIHSNIGAFAGDANNVTLFGQSSGGDGVYGNMLSPRMGGLFRRGIVQSTLPHETTSLETAHEHGVGFANAVGCNEKGAASCLRRITVPKLLAAQGPWLTGLMVDGNVIPKAMGESLRSGDFNRVPLVVGDVRTDGAWAAAVYETLTGHAMSADDYAAVMKHELPAGMEYRLRAPKRDADELQHQYPLSRHGDASSAYAAVSSDARFCADLETVKALARKVPVYFYEFAVHDAPTYFPAVSFPMGAYHTSELQFLFSLYHGGTRGVSRPLDHDQERLSKEMVTRWARFAWSDGPNLPGSLPFWPTLRELNGEALSLEAPRGRIVPVESLRGAHNCEFWQG